MSKLLVFVATLALMFVLTHGRRSKGNIIILGHGGGGGGDDDGGHHVGKCFCFVFMISNQLILF